VKNKQKKRRSSSSNRIQQKQWKAEGKAKFDSLSFSLLHKWKIIPEIALLGKFCGFTFHLPLAPGAGSLGVSFVDYYALSRALSLSPPPHHPRNRSLWVRAGRRAKESSPAHRPPPPTAHCRPTPAPNPHLGCCL